MGHYRNFTVQNRLSGIELVESDLFMFYLSMFVFFNRQNREQIFSI